MTHFNDILHNVCEKKKNVATPESIRASATQNCHRMSDTDIQAFSRKYDTAITITQYTTPTAPSPAPQLNIPESFHGSFEMRKNAWNTNLIGFFFYFFFCVLMECFTTLAHAWIMHNYIVIKTN